MVTGTNPITKLDYPDPDVICVDDTFYMISTTMHFMPGGEILRSYDLINWEHASYVFDKLDSTPAQKLEGEEHIYGKGMWAATIRYYAGKFYVLFVCNDTDKTYLYKSDSIYGPWEKSNVEGFFHDASLLFDEVDGKTHIYIVYGNTDVYLTELNAEMTAPKEGGLHRCIVRDIGNKMLGYEGSHLYKIDGRYYLFLIHSLSDHWRRVEACFTADSLEGDFVGVNVFDDDLGYRNSGIAQGGIVEGPEGVWHSIMFQDSGAVGRLPILVPVTMPGEGTGLPVFGTEGKATREAATESFKPDYKYRPLTGSDDFKYVPKELFEKDKETNGSFGFKSFWQFNHEPDLGLIDVDGEKGSLWIKTDKLSKNIYFARNTLTQRMAFPGCTGEVTLDVSKLKDGDSAGLAAFQGNYAWVGVMREEGKLYAVMSSFTNTSGDVWNLSTEPGNIVEKIELDAATISSANPDGKPVVKLRLTAIFEGKEENENDTAICEIDTGNGFRKIGTPHKLSFRLDHFAGCRFGLFIYSQKETGGAAGFSNFIYK